MKITIEFLGKQYTARENNELQTVIQGMFKDCNNTEQHKECEFLCFALQKVCVEQKSKNVLKYEEEERFKRLEREREEENKRLQIEKEAKQKQKENWDKFIPNGILFTTIDGWESLSDEEIVKKFNNLEINKSKLFDFVDYSIGIEWRFPSDLEITMCTNRELPEKNDVSVVEVQHYIAQHCAVICEGINFDNWIAGSNELYNIDKNMVLNVNLKNSKFLSEFLYDHLKEGKNLKEFKFLKKEVLECLK